MNLPWRTGLQPLKRLRLDLRHAFLRCGGHVQRRTPQPFVVQTSAMVGAPIRRNASHGAAHLYTA
jgi:hypothetical protein